MPIYVYSCNNEDCPGEPEPVEVMHSVRELGKHDEPCPTCRHSMSNKITVPAVVRLVTDRTVRHHQWYKGKGTHK